MNFEECIENFRLIHLVDRYEKGSVRPLVRIAYGDEEKGQVMLVSAKALRDLLDRVEGSIHERKLMPLDVPMIFSRLRGPFEGATLSNPRKITVSESPRTVWSVGWWKSQQTGESYLLMRHADVESFTRDEADGVMPTEGDVTHGPPPI
ncbi:MAG: hypothetical protein OXG13_10175 [Gemmatimonadaceae bacterium]|nr:hypothetical protein [Gemmatimonadaceae bacterium]